RGGAGRRAPRKDGWPSYSHAVQLWLQCRCEKNIPPFMYMANGVDRPAARAGGRGIYLPPSFGVLRREATLTLNVPADAGVPHAAARRIGATHASSVRLYESVGCPSETTSPCGPTVTTKMSSSVITSVPKRKSLSGVLSAHAAIAPMCGVSAALICPGG